MDADVLLCNLMLGHGELSESIQDLKGALRNKVGANGVHYLLFGLRMLWKNFGPLFFATLPRTLQSWKKVF